jgi:hypothetical protein
MVPRAGTIVQGRVCWEPQSLTPFPMLERETRLRGYLPSLPNRSALNLNLFVWYRNNVMHKPLDQASSHCVYALQIRPGCWTERKQAKRACSKREERCKGGWCRRGYCVSNTRKIACLGSNCMWVMLDCMFAHRVNVDAMGSVAESCWFCEMGTPRQGGDHTDLSR